MGTFPKILELFYDPRETFSNLEKKNQLTEVESEFTTFLQSEPLSENEVDLIFKYFGTKIIGKEDEKMDCHSCGRDMEIDEHFTQIPDCSHRVCKKCMKGWTSKEFKSKKCDVCENHMRIAFLKKIHGEETINHIFRDATKPQVVINVA